MNRTWNWMTALIPMALAIGCAPDAASDDPLAEHMHEAAEESDELAQLAAPTTPAATPTTPSTPTTSAAPTTSTSLPGFDPGAGTLLPDLKTVEYRIPDGTKNKDWNPRDKPINVRRGMTLRLIDEDTKAAGGGHWVHSFSICPHSTKPIGKGYECKIPQTAKVGLQSGIFEHNIANAGGRIYLVVVQ